MIKAIKESKRQGKQQNQLKQQALLTTKTQCLYIFLKKNLMKNSK